MSRGLKARHHVAQAPSATTASPARTVPPGVSATRRRPDAEARDGRALVDADATCEQGVAEPTREAGRLQVGGVAHEQPLAEHRGPDPCLDLFGGQLPVLVADPESFGRLERPSPAAGVRGRGGDGEVAGHPEPGVDARRSRTTRRSRRANAPRASAARARLPRRRCRSGRRCVPTSRRRSRRCARSARRRRCPVRAARCRARDRVPAGTTRSTCRCSRPRGSRRRRSCRRPAAEPRARRTPRGRAPRAATSCGRDRGAARRVACRAASYRVGSEPLLLP